MIQGIKAASLCDKERKWINNYRKEKCDKGKKRERERMMNKKRKKERNNVTKRERRSELVEPYERLRGRKGRKWKG